ncbi:pirin [Sulfurifustis variabilis]|uniref:Pirin n=1 Tax=Sulfurifustis variabilis TaxID=1675686 RepID=A0A1B4V249_9GAMM|nr:pirin family protein [Sulfurifustis variabilis]BAU47588.1 pirin [Sulfurifustis variabilis]
MASRSVRLLLPAAALDEGAGVTVRRTIGTPRLRHLDPFLMLDHFGSNDPDEYIAGFPDHPHRGFITLTYMIDGHMLHRDSMGNRGDLRSGGIQWMKAASGVIHSEMPQQTAGLMRGFQLWINLPAAEKMSDPEYQDVPAERIPVVEENGQRIRLIAGAHGDRRGPIVDPHTDIQYLDVSLASGSAFRHAVAADATVFAYVFEGEARSDDTRLPAHALAVFGGGDDLEIVTEESGARFILVAGRPIGEPIVQYGPFVMTSDADIRQAIEDYRQGRLARRPAGSAST